MRRPTLRAATVAATATLTFLVADLAVDIPSAAAARYKQRVRAVFYTPKRKGTFTCHVRVIRQPRAKITGCRFRSS